MGSTPNPPDTEPDDGMPASSGETVTITRAELEELRNQLSAATARAATPEVPPPTPSREAPSADELASRDRKVSELESLCKSAVRERDLATALAGKPLVAGAAPQLIKLWREELDVYEEDGLYKVASRDGRTVAQAVGAWLSSPEYSHFCLPASKGWPRLPSTSPGAGTARPAPFSAGSTNRSGVPHVTIRSYSSVAPPRHGSKR